MDTDKYACWRYITRLVVFFTLSQYLFKDIHAIMSYFFAITDRNVFFDDFTIIYSNETLFGWLIKERGFLSEIGIFSGYQLK